MKPNKISQADAARLKGVKRQRIWQLIKAKKLKLDKAGLLSAEDVINFKEGKRGRPKLTYDQLVARNPAFVFKTGEEILWSYKPRDGFGYTIYLYGTVQKIGSKRVEIEFLNFEDEKIKAWVKLDSLTSVEFLNHVG